MTMITFYVYEHWRPDTNVCFYVGKGIRRRAHEMHARNHYHKAIQSKLKQLGFAVQVKIVGEFDTEIDAYLFEAERISFWRKGGAALANLAAGGRGGTAGIKLSIESRQKLSEIHKGKVFSEETISKLKVAAKTLWESPEHRDKMAAALKGRLSGPRSPLSEETKAKIGNAHRGRVHPPKSEETRAKLSASLKGRIFSLETIEKIRNANTGKRRTAEQRQAASIARKGMKMPPKSRETIAKIVAKTTGQKRTDEQRRRISEIAKTEVNRFKEFSHLGPQSLVRPVKCVDDDQIFQSASDASRYYNVSRSALIELCLGKKHRKTVGGLRFQYIEAV